MSDNITPSELPEPFDPMCERRAAQMEELDGAIFSSYEEVQEQSADELAAARIAYVRAEEGTYNPDNGHFLCDNCYMKAGMPSGSDGWRCP